MKMRVYLIALGSTLLLAATIPAIRAQCGAPCDELDDWRDIVFSKISRLPSQGSWTRLMTFRDTAYVALSGSALTDSIFALATLGNGRVAAFTNVNYVKNFGKTENVRKIRKLHGNLLEWLEDGSSATWEICHPTSSSELSTCLNNQNVKTLVLQGNIWPTEADNAAVKTWVEQGNSLVHGFDRAAFEAATSESAKHIGFYSTLLAAGIAYEQRSAMVPTDIYTNEPAVNLVNLNLKTSADSLTWSNFESNSRLNYVLDLVKNNPRYFLAEVSNHVLSPFEAFATNMEVNMVWPVAGPGNDLHVATTSRQQAMYNVYYVLSMAHLWRLKAPTVDKFPGDIPNPPATETASFSFQSKRWRYFFTTGYYLVAGQEMTITINNAAGDDTYKAFEVYISMYTDSLTNKDELRRFPLIKRVVTLVDREMTIRWPFGGLVYVRSSPELNNNLDMTISGVIPTPHMDIINDQSIDATWSSRCQSSGLSADLHGEWVRFTLPVADSGICTMTGQQVKDLLAKWDKVVLKNWQLRGGQSAWKQQSFACDIQLSGGFLHSGFPIVGHYLHCNQSSEYAYYNYMSGNWSSQWGPFHELGHNQDSKYYLFPEVIETVPNIFSYFQMERMAGYTWDTLPLLHKHIAAPEMTAWLAAPSWTNVNYDAFIRYVVYTQLIRDFGWGCQKDVFGGYMDDAEQGNPLPTTNHEEIQEWVIRWSEQVGYNLCPLFGDFWKWPLDTATCDGLNNLTPYLPDDIVTQRTDAASLTASVVAAYPNLVRTVSTSPPCAPFDIEPLV